MKRGLVAGILLVGTLPVWAGTFRDIQDPYRQVAAEALHKRKIMSALSPDEFGASNPVTKYDLAEILDSLLDPREMPFQVISFTDIPPGHRQAKAANRLVSFGILRSNGGMFSGNQRISRVDLLESLDKLLTYRSIPRPPKRKGAYFPDVKQGNSAYAKVDRAANYWNLIENPEYIPFRPYEQITRGEAAEIIAKAAALVDPSLIDSLHTPVPATPEPTPEVTAEPTPMDSGSTESTSSVTSSQGTASVTPAPVKTPETLLQSEAHLGQTYFITYDLAPNGNDAPGGISTFQANIQYWSGGYGGIFDFNTTILPGFISNNYQYHNQIVHVDGLMRLPWQQSRVFETAAGLGLFLRMHTVDQVASDPTDYFTNSRTYLSLGPVFVGAYRPVEHFHLLFKGALYPLMYQTAGMFMGINLQGEGRYDIMANGPGMLTFHAGFNGQYDVGYSGGLGAMTGGYLGLGQSF